MGQARNTRAERRCKDCAGTGAFELPAHDPQHDTFRACATCKGEGWIRWAPVDPIEHLAGARRDFMRCFPSGERAGLRYGDIRQRVVSPVNLPRDRVPSLSEIYAELSKALAEHRRQLEAHRRLLRSIGIAA